MRTTRRDRSAESPAGASRDPHLGSGTGPALQSAGSEPGSWVSTDRAPVSVVVGSAGASFTKNSALSYRGGWEMYGYCEAVMYEFGYSRRGSEYFNRFRRF